MNLNEILNKLNWNLDEVQSILVDHIRHNFSEEELQTLTDELNSLTQ